MADGIAPAVDKVGAPEPTAPEAQAQAPTMDTTTVHPAAQPAKSEEAKKIEEGAGPAVAAPKPVEVLSVPDTPINNQTPAGGTPRPVLDVDEPKPALKKDEDVEMERVQGDASNNGAANDKKGEASIADKIVDTVTNGAAKVAEVASEALPGTGEKRKAEDEPAAAEATNGDIVSDKPDSEERSGKKARVDDAGADADEAAPDTNGKPGPGRPKKKAGKEPVVGKTLRKTRSQGPVEV